MQSFITGDQVVPEPLSVAHLVACECTKALPALSGATTGCDSTLNTNTTLAIVKQEEKVFVCSTIVNT